MYCICNDNTEFEFVMVNVRLRDYVKNEGGCVRMRERMKMV